MKKLLVVGLMCFITLLFTGCEQAKNEQGINMKKAIKTYGDNYQIVELSKSDFLIVWDDAKLIFNNNECIGYVSLH